MEKYDVHFRWIGDNILWLRKRNFITQEQLALELFKGAGRISDIEHHKTLPTCEEICQIAQYFGVSFDTILAKDGFMKPNETAFYKLKEENNQLRAQNKELKAKLRRR